MQELAGYRILGELGRGAMGVVYKALDPKLGRVVALKILAPELALDPVIVKRFSREARAAAGVVHPHVVTVHTTFEHQGHRVLVTEHVAGGSLMDRARRDGPLPWREVARLGGQVASALVALHAAGIVHRDVKPSNVLIDSEGSAKLSDFGLARRRPGLESQRLTADGEIVGTLGFLAPEQACGETADPRGDVYSLGATMFFLLTGRLVFVGPPLDVVARLVHEPPPSPRALAPDTPADFAALILAILAKDPARRPSAESLVDTLAALASRPDEKPAPAPDRTRVRIALVLVALVLACGLGALAVAATRRGPAPDAGPAPRAPVVSPAPAPRPAPPAPPAFACPPAPAAIQSLSVPWAKVVGCYATPDAPEHDEVRGLRFAPDGLHFVSTHKSGYARIWDTRYGTEKPLVGHRGVCYTAAFSPDGARVVTGGHDCRVRLWDVADGVSVRVFDDLHGRGVHWVGYMEPKRVVSASTDGTIVTWDAETGHPVEESGKRDGDRDRGFLEGAMSRDGRRLFLGREDHRVMLYELPTPALLHEAPAADQVHAVACSPAGDEGVSGDHKGHLRVWRFGEFESRELAELAEPIDAVAYLSDGRRFLVATRDGHLTVWDPTPPGRALPEPIELQGLDDDVKCIAFAPDARTFLVGTEKGRIIAFASAGP